ncbi:pre-16S rRNA-processing nuclease YqgF [Azotosporobacter soli]|uniref:pre-16S rRNA-processing nuclease YqgF n=1 Tax=Azotosporobacter soli TaxID=3055040 RepID=UPI0031FE6D49
MGEELLLAIDPGREKCGVALLTMAGSVLQQEVVARTALGDWLRQCRLRYSVDLAVIGHRTASGSIRTLAEEAGYRVELINEDFSTEQARQRYWQAHPPQGWRSLLPQGLLVPPKPVDDYVAVILGERFLSKEKGEYVKNT